MALVPVGTRNRVNPVTISTIEQPNVPYGAYDHVEVCNDPYCPTCREQRGDRHHRHRHHHKRHHRHKKHRGNMWDTFIRGESASSIISVHGVELDDRRPYYNSQVTERSLVPVNQTERQVVSTTNRQRYVDDNIAREAWVNNPTNEDEVVCCRAYDGCRCPCWCCIILIIIFVILIIVLIILLATLL